MNAFEKHGIDHLSPSSLNLWLSAPSLWVMEKLLGFRGDVGCAAHRGTAVETGVSAGLFDPDLPITECRDMALFQFNRLTALSGDPKREDERAAVPLMVEEGLKALRHKGAPIRPNEPARFGSGEQHKVSVTLDGVAVPVIGYLDWLYPEEIIDLKTTHRVPSSMSETHLRQATIYKVAHPDRRVRFVYVSSKKSETHTLTREDYDAALKQIVGAARRLERFLSLSSDREELAQIIPHSADSFYFNDPTTKAKALEVYGY